MDESDLSWALLDDFDIPAPEQAYLSNTTASHVSTLPSQQSMTFPGNDQGYSSTTYPSNVPAQTETVGIDDNFLGGEVNAHLQHGRRIGQGTYESADTFMLPASTSSVPQQWSDVPDLPVVSDWPLPEVPEWPSPKVSDPPLRDVPDWSLPDVPDWPLPEVPEDLTSEALFQQDWTQEDLGPYDAQQLTTAKAQLHSGANAYELLVPDFDVHSEENSDNNDEEEVETTKPTGKATKRANRSHPYDGLSTAMEKIEKFQEVCSTTQKAYKVGRTVTKNGQLYSLEIAGGGEVPAQYLYTYVCGLPAGVDLRKGPHGETYRETGTEGRDSAVPNDFTAFLDSQQNWTQARDDGRPAILFQYKCTDGRKGYRAHRHNLKLNEVMRLQDGTVLLSADGFPIRELAHMPFTVSTKLAAYRCIAIERLNKAIGHPDFHARMAPALKWRKSEWIDGRMGKSAFNQAKVRTRETMRIIDWTGKDKEETVFEKTIERDLNEADRAGNTTKNLVDLDTEDKTLLNNISYGLKLNRAGGNKLDKGKRLQKMQTHLESMKKLGHGEESTICKDQQDKIQALEAETLENLQAKGRSRKAVTPGSRASSLSRNLLSVPEADAATNSLTPVALDFSNVDTEDFTDSLRSQSTYLSTGSGATARDRLWQGFPAYLDDHSTVTDLEQALFQPDATSTSVATPASAWRASQRYASSRFSSATKRKYASDAGESKGDHTHQPQKRTRVSNASSLPSAGVKYGLSHFVVSDREGSAHYPDSAQDPKKNPSFDAQQSRADDTNSTSSHPRKRKRCTDAEDSSAYHNQYAASNLPLWKKSKLGSEIESADFSLEPSASSDPGKWMDIFDVESIAASHTEPATNDQPQSKRKQPASSGQGTNTKRNQSARQGQDQALSDLRFDWEWYRL